MFRRRFKSAFRRPGMDPATFATELGILALWRFGDMGKRARDAMIRDKFIAGQRHCGLRRQFDGFAPDTPIGEIVYSCRVWESHSDREPSSDDDQGRDSRRQSGDSRKLERKKSVSQEVPEISGVDSRKPVFGVGVDSRNGVEDSQLAPLRAISSLVTRLLHSAQKEPPVEENIPWEKQISLLSAEVPVCFSCGRQGHGINRCSRVNTSFPFLPPWWSVNVRNGQYRATRMEGAGLRSPPGKREMVRAGGSASRIIGDQSLTDPGGGLGRSKRRPLLWQPPVGRGLGSHWASNTQDFPALGSQPKTVRGGGDKDLLGRTDEVVASGN